MRILRHPLGICFLFAAVLHAPAPARAETPPAHALVDRAFAALGGAPYGQLHTTEIEGKATYWDPGQSREPGGQPRIESRAAFKEIRDLRSGNSRTEWEKIYYKNPWQRVNRFTEIFADGKGYVIGIDGTWPTARQRSSTTEPPQRWMSAMRMTATLRELRRTSPALIASIRADANGTRLLDATAAQTALPTIAYDRDGFRFEISFHPETGLPFRIRTRDFDMLEGDSAFDLLFGDWRDVDGVRLPFRSEYRLNGRKLAQIEIDSIKINQPVRPDQFRLASGVDANAPDPLDPAATHFQWVIRRQYIGSYLDADAISHDPTNMQRELIDLAPGISHAAGSVHHALVVEMQDHLIIFDAPYSDTHSRWIMAEAAKKYPGKPVRYIVLTHHHSDHMAGFRAYTSAGATLVVGAGYRAFWMNALTRPSMLGVDTPKTPYDPKLIEVSDQITLSDGKRNVRVYLIPNPHSEGMVMGYVEDSKLAYECDIWTPGRDTMSIVAQPDQKAVVDFVAYARLDVGMVAGCHGSAAPLANLQRTAQTE